MADETTSATRVLRQGERVVGARVRAYELAIGARGGPVRRERIAAEVLRVGSREEGNDLVLADPAVSRLHFEIVAEPFGHRVRDLGSRNGTWVEGLRVHDAYLRPGATLRAGETELVYRPLADEAELPLSEARGFGPLVGESAAMRALFATLERAAKTPATILLEGESGTGKEGAALAVHQASARREGPLVVFDCAAVPATLLESELFGHERGAFTGAVASRAGCMEEADGGTLFIDEIGELPLELQPKLLRVLEKREYRRLGGTRAASVDVRIVAATNRDLACEVNRGTFREDLYYRLAVIRVRIPPLRERPEDLPLLVRHFVLALAGGRVPEAEAILAGIQPENWARLRAHPWPGNVRELKNVVERTLALTGELGGPMEPTGRHAAAVAGGVAAAAAPDLERPMLEQKGELVEAFERSYLSQMLARHNGNFSRAAAATGVDRMYFKRLLKKYNLP